MTPAVKELYRDIKEGRKSINIERLFEKEKLEDTRDRMFKTYYGEDYKEDRISENPHNQNVK